MNNKNKILVGCLALLLVLSVGYALFSETITINGTATAKGSFDITPSCQIGLPSSMASLLKNDGYTVVYDEVGTENDSCDVVGNTVTINTDMLYPTAARFFTVEMKNTGTMDAVISVEQLEAVYDDISINLYKKSDNSFYKTISGTEVNDYGDFEMRYLFIKLSNGTLIYKDADLMANESTLMDTQTAYLRIKPNESFVIVFLAYWDEDAVQTEYYSKAEMSTELPFKQVTSDMTEWVLDDFCLNGC